MSLIKTLLKESILSSNDKTILKNSTWKDYDIQDILPIHKYLDSEVIFNKELSFDLSEYFTVDVVYESKPLQIVRIDGLWLDDDLRGLGIGYKAFKAIAVKFGSIFDSKKNMSKDGRKLFEKISQDEDFEVLGLDSEQSKYVLVIHKANPLSDKLKEWFKKYN
jgi:hypothetical protein